MERFLATPTDQQLTVDMERKFVRLAFIKPKMNTKRLGYVYILILIPSKFHEYPAMQQI